MWLPVIKKLKEKGNIKIDFVFPEPSSIRLEEKSSTLLNLAEQYVDDVIYRGYSKRWFIAPTLLKANSGIKYSNFDAIIERFSKKLIGGKASKFFILKLFGKYISAISEFFYRVKEDLGGNTPYDVSLMSSIDGVLCDITKESKFVNVELRENLKTSLKFSIPEGLLPLWFNNSLVCKKSVEKRPNVIVYTLSNLEKDGYKKCHGVLEKNIVHAGITRHDRDYIEFICNQPNAIDEKDFNSSYVFLVGRPSSPYLTIERKKKAIKEIHDIICLKYKLKLIVKTHPKESSKGIDGDIYREILGMKNYGKTWLFSDRHPFILGQKSLFSIAFYSGVPLDMLAIKKPSIEYLNLENLTLYDNSDSLRDEHGKPVFPYRYAKLVLGVDSKSELEQNVESILNQYEATLSTLYSKYEEYYKPFKGSSEMVANDICRRIDDIKSESV